MGYVLRGRVWLALSAWLFVVCGSGLGRCPKYASLPKFDVRKLSGQWYEVERSFGLSEVAASCTAIRIEAIDRGQVYVNATTVNRWTNAASWSSGVGVPSVPGSSVFRYKPRSRMPHLITRYLPGAGMYHVLFTDYRKFVILWSCYSIAFVYTDQIWLLGRQRDFPAPLRAHIYSVLRHLGLDPERLILARNKFCPY